MNSFAVVSLGLCGGAACGLGGLGGPGGLLSRVAGGLAAKLALDHIVGQNDEDGPELPLPLGLDLFEDVVEL